MAPASAAGVPPNGVFNELSKSDRKSAKIRFRVHIVRMSCPD